MLSIILINVAHPTTGGKESESKCNFIVAWPMSVCKGGGFRGEKSWVENDVHEIDRRSVTRAKNN